MQTKYLCVLIHIWIKGEVGAMIVVFPDHTSVKYFTDHSKAVLLLCIFLCFFLSCVCYAFVRVCLYVPCGHLLGKSWPLGSHLWCLTVNWSLSHWYPGSVVVLDCIDSRSLHPYLFGLWSFSSLSSWCLVMVEQLFLAVAGGCLRFLIVVFPDHTHLLFLVTSSLVDGSYAGEAYSSKSLMSAV